MMKKILIPVIGLIVFLSFCNQRAFTNDAENGQWINFVSPMNDYSLEYPQDWIINKVNSIYVTLNGPENEQIKQNIKPEYHLPSGLIKAGQGYMDDITIAYYSSGDNFAGYPTFKDWLEDVDNPNRYISNVEKIELAGIETWEMKMTGSQTAYIIMVEYNGHLYQIGFNNRSDKIDLTDIEKKIIESFKFIE